MNTFEDTLNVFLDFCESDEMFSAIHLQLLSVPGAEFDSWYQERRKTGGQLSFQIRP